MDEQEILNQRIVGQCTVAYVTMLRRHVVRLPGCIRRRAM